MDIDLNVTSTCNLGCKYCSEGHNPLMPDRSKIENSKTNLDKENLYKFISDLHSAKPEEKVKISFWGGEPMMNMNYCMDVMRHYATDNRITFFFYTNGTYINKYLHLIMEIHNKVGRERLIIQISYDGNIINDIERVTKKDQSTSKVVKESFKLLHDHGVNVMFKSTITPKTFKYIFDAYLDIAFTPGSANYFPTPDTHADFDNPEQYLKDLKKGLMCIARHIYENNLKPETFAWFSKSNALCQAGIDYYAIDLDGVVSPCHGTLYDTFDDHELGHITDDDIFQKLDQAANKYENMMPKIQMDCAGCDAYYCLKCPAGTYNLPSTTEEYTTYSERWSAKNINMCQVFKLNDVVHKSLLYSLQTRK